MISTILNLKKRRMIIKKRIGLNSSTNSPDVYPILPLKEGNKDTFGPYDLLIASIAIANNVTLVTHNTREFSRVEGLDYEDWEE